MELARVLTMSSLTVAEGSGGQAKGGWLAGW